MRHSRIVIVTLIAAALVALVVVIVKYGPLATTQSATSSPAGAGQSSTPSAVASSGRSATVTAAPSVTSGPASPAASVSPSATAAAPAPSASADRRTVKVVVTYLDWDATAGVVEAGAYATTVEGAGTCTLKLTFGGRSGTGSIAALADASTMSCGGLTVPRDRLSSGTWTAVITYESATSVGTSDPVEVVVP